MAETLSDDEKGNDVSIRCASKAIIIRENHILLNRCFYPDGGVYYDLPGGGQHPFESMEQAVMREIREETGYCARVLRLAALSEEIWTDEELCRLYPDYCHRILHVFHAEVLSDAPCAPSEKDMGMDRCVWIPIDDVAGLAETNPTYIKTELKRILAASGPLYFGTEYRGR